MIKEQKIVLRDVQYSVSSQGAGRNALAIGIASLLLRTLPENVYAKLQVHFSDSYWVNERSEQLESFTLQSLVEDIKAICEQLDLQQVILLAHSCYGILALEVARIYPELVSGVIMLGSPPSWDETVVKENDAIFQAIADSERREADSNYRKVFSGDPASFIETYVLRDRARIWADPHYDCSWMWEGLSELNQPLLDHFFETLLPDYNTTLMKQVNCPVYLAAGQLDFDSCPASRWDACESKPSNMTIVEFEQSGHYPHFEEPQQFNTTLNEWLKKL